MEWRLLEGVPAEEVRQLLAVARRRTFRRGEVVLHQDDPADSLHLVVKGRFAVRVTTPLGEQATVAVNGPGDIFGEIALLGDDSRRSATVEALEEAETLCVHELDFARVRREHPEVNEVMIRYLANEVRVMNERLLEALYVPAERRVLRRVGELARTYPGKGDAPAEIPLTQEILAGMAGTSRATVNAVLRDAQSRGPRRARPRQGVGHRPGRPRQACAVGSTARGNLRGSCAPRHDSGRVEGHPAPRPSRARLRGRVKFAELLGAERLLQIELDANPIVTDEVLALTTEADSTGGSAIRPKVGQRSGPCHGASTCTRAPAGAISPRSAVLDRAARSSSTCGPVARFR